MRWMKNPVFYSSILPFMTILHKSKTLFIKIAFLRSLLIHPEKSFAFLWWLETNRLIRKIFFAANFFFAFSSLLSSELRSCRRRAKCEHKPVTWLHLHPLTCADADADAAEVAAAVGNRRSAAEDSRNIVSFQGLIRRCLLNGQDWQKVLKAASLFPGLRRNGNKRIYYLINRIRWPFFCTTNDAIFL